MCLARSLVVPSCSGALLPGALLAGNGLLRALARPRVGACALSVHGQPPAVPESLVASDLDLALDVGRDLAAEVALDLQVGVDVAAELRDLFIGEVADTGVARDVHTVADLV